MFFVAAALFVILGVFLALLCYVAIVRGWFERKPAPRKEEVVPSGESEEGTIRGKGFFEQKRAKIEFQLELLRIQLKHERECAFYSALTALGASFIVFTLSVFATVKDMPVILFQMLYAYFWVGAILGVGSLLLFILLKSSEKKDLTNVRKKYSNQ